MAVVLPYWKFAKRREKMIAQIPLLIDQLIRSLNTGRNLDGAFLLATEEAQSPLRDVMLRVQNTVELGGDIVDALHDYARTLDLTELHYIALAFQMTRNYGSSPKEMLEGLVSLIRQREQAGRELRAMTGETRMSAWVLGLLPTAMAIYMIAVNPGYMQSMYSDPSGRLMLLGAAGMQALGGVVLWRMVKNI
jgi:tight adherence protein B